MYRVFIKRFFDVLLSLMALPFTFLAVLVFVPLIYFEDKGPVFYNAPRRGMNGNVFTMYKLRSMKMNAPHIRAKDGSAYSSAHDPRVTKIGRFLRKTSLDEIPQILNVLKGEMSFIGPRPNLATGDYLKFDGIRKKRLTVRPGITGYSQAFFRNSIAQEQKFINDCYYVDHLSFMLDLKILFHTIFSVYQHKNIYTNLDEVKEERAN